MLAGTLGQVAAAPRPAARLALLDGRPAGQVSMAIRTDNQHTRRDPFVHNASGRHQAFCASTGRTQTDGLRRDVDPRRRCWARAGGSGQDVHRGDGRLHPLGRTGSRRGRDGQAGHAHARQRDRIVPPHQGRAQGPGHDARRHRLPQRQRLSPPGTRPLCLRPPVQGLQGRAHLLFAERRSTW